MLEGAVEEENASTGIGKPDATSAYQQTMDHTVSCHQVFRFHIISSVYWGRPEALCPGRKTSHEAGSALMRSHEQPPLAVVWWPLRLPTLDTLALQGSPE